MKTKIKAKSHNRILTSQALEKMRFCHLEQKATRSLKRSVNAWITFCKTALQIKASQQYKRVSKTWKEYVRKTWGLDDSRIRQFKSALPYAERIILAMPDTAINDTSMRHLKRIINFEDERLVGVYVLANQVASELGKSPTEALYRHTLAVIEENNLTGGIVSIDGAEIPSIMPNALATAVLNRMDEAQGRFITRLKSGTINNKIKIELQFTRLENGTWSVIASKECDLPDTLGFNYYISGGDNLNEKEVSPKSYQDDLDKREKDSEIAIRAIKTQAVESLYSLAKVSQRVFEQDSGT